jgi:hypothetical protein
MNIINDLITDRTQDDVNELVSILTQIKNNGFGSISDADKEKYLNGMRGAYTHIDLNRVGEAVLYISNRMLSLQGELDSYRKDLFVSGGSFYDVPYDVGKVSVSPKTNWTGTDIFDYSSEALYIKDLKTLESVLSLPAGSPSAPSKLGKMNYKTANDIEKLLTVIYEEFSSIENKLYSRINRTVSGMNYTNLFFAGE